MENQITIHRYINGISLNGTEMLLDDNNNPMVFQSKEVAFEFLRENGHEEWTDEEFEDNYLFLELTE